MYRIQKHACKIRVPHCNATFPPLITMKQENLIPQQHSQSKTARVYISRYTFHDFVGASNCVGIRISLPRSCFRHGWSTKRNYSLNLTPSLPRETAIFLSKISETPVKCILSKHREIKSTFKWRLNRKWNYVNPRTTFGGKILW